MLLAPSPGEETRSSIVGKVHDFGDKVRERFSPEVKKPATGTEGMQAPRRAFGNGRLADPWCSVLSTAPPPHGPARGRSMSAKLSRTAFSDHITTTLRSLEEEIRVGATDFLRSAELVYMQLC